MPREKPPVLKLHELKVGQTADVFAKLAEKTRHVKRDGKPYYQCRFKDARRAVGCVLWADSGLFPDCEASWEPGFVYKLRGTLTNHDRYGLQLDVRNARPAADADKEDGYDPAAFNEGGRFDPAALFAEVRQLADEIRDEPLRALVAGLLDTHADLLQLLPASDRRFYPHPGGWLEHVRNVAHNCLWLADRYAERFPELAPPLNRDLVLAGALLHDLGRAAEFVPGQPGLPPEFTVPGRLLGHIQLGRDLLRDAAKSVPDLNPELVLLLDHLILSHLERPEWGSPRLPMIPEALILHHADDLDAKFDMYVRSLTRDASDGPFTDRDAAVGKILLKRRGV